MTTEQTGGLVDMVHMMMKGVSESHQWWEIPSYEVTKYRQSST